MKIKSTLLSLLGIFIWTTAHGQDTSSNSSPASQPPPPLIMDNQTPIPSEPNETTGFEYNKDFDVKQSEEAARAEKENTKESQTEVINSKTAQDIRAHQKSFDSGSEHFEVVPYYKNLPKPELKKKLRNGTLVYKTEPSPQHYSGGFRIGPYIPANLKGDTSSITYKQVYGNNSPIAFAVDMEWQFFKGAGKLGMQGGVGFFSASGRGRFLNPSLSNLESDTTMTLYCFPMQASLLYHLQLFDKQVLVPFAGGGGDYFGMIESRDDKDSFREKLKIGGALAAHWVAGLQIQLDFIDKDLIWQVDHDYGINHIYLTADYRQIIGLSSVYDFSGSYYEGGFLFEF